jgi:predicted DNA-binding transcriptional regulator YafY
MKKQQCKYWKEIKEYLNDNGPTKIDTPQLYNNFEIKNLNELEKAFICLEVNNKLIRTKKDNCDYWDLKPTKPRNILKSLPIDVEEYILNFLKENGPTAAKTPELYDSINKTYKSLEDAFKYLESKNILICEKKSRTNYWRIKDKNLLNEKLAQKDFLSLNYAIKQNKKDFDLSTMKAIEKIFKVNKEYMEGHLSFYEEFKDERISAFYDDLIKSIKEHLYLKLTFTYDRQSRYNNVKPVKIVFIDNNWYIAFEYTDNKKRKDFVFRRLAFLRELIFLKDFDYSNKHSYQKKETQKYIEYLKTVQNSMTLYGVEKKKALLKASPMIAKYFKEDMKKFLSSQKFVEELEDGSVTFEVSYTQDLEVLPFVQKWLPDLVVLEPKELKENYTEKLQTILNNLNK